MTPVRIVFMGSPQPAVAVLDAVVEVATANGWAMVAAYTAPDKPEGRGRRLSSTPVRLRAEELGIPVCTPKRLTLLEEQERFRALNGDLVVLAAYGLLLPPPFLFEPRYGAVNVHPSLLPRHRGAAPVAAAILAGDTRTGVTIMAMNEGLDTGPLLASRDIPLVGDERTPALTERLFALGGEMLAEMLPRYVAGEVASRPQPEEGATYTARISKADGLIDWREPARMIERRVRAYDPWPGAAAVWEGRRVTITSAAVVPGEGDASPGEVWTRGEVVLVGTGNGALQLLRVKMEGRPEMDIAEFLRGRPAFSGARLEYR
ncbi:MAG: methionyl-tRNA formyltransferase [Chloroflexota bacterium]|nr:methionyl-tRNA formyltransferase [Chloroflexota bacterium]MDE2886404.1 methionyl-tRNA formyltransferase [Chloroflexota bacterium]